MPVSGRALTILVVDDDPAIRDVLEMALETEGYNVVSAENGEAALRPVELYFPDLMLVDLMMPVMSGWHFITECRKRSAC